MNKVNSIMLVDDDATTNFLNELLIGQMGITSEVIIAQNGREALEKLQEQCLTRGQCPELILLDINMPVLNGFGFLEAYQQLTSKQQVTSVIVMLTTSLNPKDIAKGKEYRVAGFLNKPLLEKDLEEMVNKYFG